MNGKLNEYKSVLKESSLSRLLSHIHKYDTGTITAFRSSYTRNENLRRNKSLHAQLSAAGFGITEVKGAYVENFSTPEAVEVGESVFFVVDLKGKGKLREVLRKLGELWEQDSILFIPRGGQNSELWGTNHISDYPGYGNKVMFPVMKMGKDDSQFLTRVKGRPFYFESVLRESYCGNLSGLHAASIMAKKDWRTLPL